MKMPLRLTCRDATRLMLMAQDKTLTRTERLAVRLHLGMCRACTNFSGQVKLMRSAMARWRAYADDDEPPPSA